MTVSPVAAIASAAQSLPNLAGIDTDFASVGGLAPVQAATTANTSSGSDFGTLLANGIDSLEGLQNNSSNLAVQAATGDLGAIQDYTIASTEASTATQLAVTLRNQAVSAFNQIMNMPA
jgi:flagellar hook-basal body complex protein FliE